MNRRRFNQLIAAASLVRPSAAAVQMEFVRAGNPYAELLRDIEPGHDDFPFEKDAVEIAARFQNLVRTHSLPLASDFRGFSPLPTSYKAVAEGVSQAEFDVSNRDFEGGMRKWIESLGSIRNARFFVLPADMLRFEIASADSYRVGLWKHVWRDGRLTEFAPVEETVTTAREPLFADVTTRAFQGVDSFDKQLARGVPYWRGRLDSASGIDVHGHNGIAAGDIDGDGWDEIYVLQPGGLPNRLYKNRGDGSFEDIADQAGVGVLDPTSSALFADFRNTGRQDLVVLRPDGPLYFVNEGNSRFSIQPGAFRFRTVPQGNFTGMAAADYDRDGRLDLYLCTYSFFRDGSQYRYPVPYFDAQNGPANFLFHNELTGGDGMFVDVTEATGLNENNNRFSFAPAWCDYDGDGWPDLYVANDFGRKNLYKNEQGKFRDVAAHAGVEDPGDGMSAAWFDYDGDGLPDLYVSNMWSDAGQRVVSNKGLEPAGIWRRHAKGNSLYRNRGDGTFEDTGAAEGVEMGRWAWSSDGIDFDNDGTPEIFITTGMLTNSSEIDLESFFWRKIAAKSPSTSVSNADYENAWNALSQAAHESYSEAGRQANVFYVRRGGRYRDFSGVSGLDLAEDSRAFAVTDFDGDGNLDLILKSRLGPQVRVFENNSTAGRKSIAIGLRGVTSNRDAIGARVTVDGQVKFVQAGSGYLSQHTKVLYFGLGAADMARTVRIDWPSGERQEFRELPAGFRHEFTEGSSEVRRRAFLTRKNAPAQPATARGDNSSQFGDTWLLEAVPLPEKAAAGFLQLTGQLSKEHAAWYGLFGRYLFDLHADLKMPVWFLVDEQSRAHKIYFSRPDLKDLVSMRDPDRLKIALPFAGTYYTRPRRNYSSLGAAFFTAGYPDQALQYLEQAPQGDPKVLLAIGRIHLQDGRLTQARIYISKGLALDAGSAEGWNNLGSIEVGSGDLRKALVNYEKALALRPDMASALINAGQVHTAVGELAEAEKLFRRALEVNPKDAEAANQMGQLMALRKQEGEAKQWFQKAIADRRDFAPAINNLGMLYARNGQTNDAIAAFLYGTEVAPDDESFYLNLANTYAVTGDAQRAREAVERLLARKPGSERGKQALRELRDR